MACEDIRADNFSIVPFLRVQWPYVQRELRLFTIDIYPNHENASRLTENMRGKVVERLENIVGIVAINATEILVSILGAAPVVSSNEHRMEVSKAFEDIILEYALENRDVATLRRFRASKQDRANESSLALDLGQGCQHRVIEIVDVAAHRSELSGRQENTIKRTYS